jgi:ABC-type uncharacterized transport system fused permease/ATPase subunit
MIGEAGSAREPRQPEPEPAPQLIQISGRAMMAQDVAVHDAACPDDHDDGMMMVIIILLVIMMTMMMTIMYDDDDEMIMMMMMMRRRSMTTMTMMIMMMMMVVVMVVMMKTITMMIMMVWCWRRRWRLLGLSWLRHRWRTKHVAPDNHQSSEAATSSSGSGGP